MIWVVEALWKRGNVWLPTGDVALSKRHAEIVLMERRHNHPGVKLKLVKYVRKEEE